MFLAFREIRRAKARFGLLVAAVGLLFFLILTQQALQNGLITSFVGAIEVQSAPVLVYSVDGQRTLQGSRIPPPLEQAIADHPDVDAVGRIGQGTFTVVVSGEGEAPPEPVTADASDAAIIGYERVDLGAPERLSAGRLPEAPGEAVGSEADFALGDRASVVSPSGGAGHELVVVGLAPDAQLQVTPTLFVAWPDYEAAARAVNPDAGDVLPNVVGARPRPGVTPEALAAALNAADEEAEALTRRQAADDAPGVSQVRSSFQVIFLLFALVVPLVTGLFFLIVTFQKSRSLTLLRAIGAPAGALVRSLLVQVVAVIGGGVLVGVLLYAPVSQVGLGTLDLRFDPAAVGLWAALLLALGVVSSAVAARRVLAIDPIEATTGGGAR